MSSHTLSGSDLVPLLWGMPRTKRPSADLRRDYGKMMRISLGLSVLLNALLFLFLSQFEFDRPIARPQTVITFDDQTVPETFQVLRTPIARPVEPIAAPEQTAEAPAQLQSNQLEADLSELVPPPPLVAEATEPASSQAASGPAADGPEAAVAAVQSDNAAQNPPPRIGQLSGTGRPHRLWWYGLSQRLGQRRGSNRKSQTPRPSKHFFAAGRVLRSGQAGGAAICLCAGHQGWPAHRRVGQHSLFLLSSRQGLGRSVEWPGRDLGRWRSGTNLQHAGDYRSGIWALAAPILRA